MTTESERPGLYLTAARTVLQCCWLVPLWCGWRLLAKKFGWKSRVNGKDRPEVAEVYQLLSFVLLLSCLAVAQPSGRLRWLFFLFAMYRSWEILAYALRWILVDRGPLHAARRSLIALVINILEVSAAAVVIQITFGKVAPTPNRWLCFRDAVEALVQFDRPPFLTEPFSTIFVIESGVLVVFALASVVGAIQRDDQSVA